MGSPVLNSRFGLECLNQHWFLDVEGARRRIEAWRQDYNHVRPHGAIGNQEPIDLVASTDRACLVVQQPGL